MNAQEIIEKICSSDIGTGEMIENFEGPNADGFGQCEIVYSHGGYEGGGDYAERVVHFKDHNVFIQITGYYSSYDGTTWDGTWKEVAPKEKTITVYE